MYIQFTVFSINFLVMVKKNDSFSVLVFLKVVFFLHVVGNERL